MKFHRRADGTIGYCRASKKPCSFEEVSVEEASRFRSTRVNNEDAGLALEVLLADIAQVKVDSAYRGRASENAYNRISRSEAGVRLRQLFRPGSPYTIAEHTAEGSGTHDFILVDGTTLSAKSNKRVWGKIAPHLGQRSSRKFLIDHGLPASHDRGERYRACFDYVETHFEEFLLEQWKNLFKSDRLLYVSAVEASNPQVLFISNKPSTPGAFITARLVKVSNQSAFVVCSVDGAEAKLGEIQTHTNRDNFKFRFTMKSVAALIGGN